MQMQRIVIKDGWHGLWYRIGAKGNNAWGAFLNLIEQYAERHRYYHDFSHIMQVLKEFEEVKHLCKNPDAVEMDLWRHDIIYKPGETDNEKMSAMSTSKMLHDAGLPEPYIQEVDRLILLTKEHEIINVKTDNDGALSNDIDLSIFGQPRPVFDLYDRNIWKEWVLGKVVSDDEFTKGRAEFLEGFLKRRIYSTPYFHAKYEKMAKANLRRSLKQLEKVKQLQKVA